MVIGFLLGYFRRPHNHQRNTLTILCPTRLSHSWVYTSDFPILRERTRHILLRFCFPQGGVRPGMSQWALCQILTSALYTDRNGDHFYLSIIFILERELKGPLLLSRSFCSLLHALKDM